MSWQCEYCSRLVLKRRALSQDVVRIQVRLIRLLGVRLGYDYLNTPIAEVGSLFGLQPLHERRKYIDLLFLYKLVNGVLDCPSLLSDNDIYTPRGTRSRSIFLRRYKPTNYSANHGMARLLKLGSKATCIDLFAESAQSLRRKYNLHCAQEGR
ncbi:hypothetical protein J6590_097095 [Homalodisca vitripennis]|nr:hypothetical protein J6590_097095 [Homalodisca vitripennis]